MNDDGGRRVAEMRRGRGGEAEEIFGCRIDRVTALIIYVSCGYFLGQRIREDAF